MRSMITSVAMKLCGARHLVSICIAGTLCTGSQRKYHACKSLLQRTTVSFALFRSKCNLRTHKVTLVALRKLEQYQSSFRNLEGREYGDPAERQNNRKVPHPSRRVKFRKNEPIMLVLILTNNTFGSRFATVLLHCQTNGYGCKTWIMDTDAGITVVLGTRSIKSGSWDGKGTV